MTLDTHEPSSGTDQSQGQPNPISGNLYEIQILNRRYFTVKGLSKLIRVSPRTLHRWHDLRRGPPRIKVGKTLLFDAEGVISWLAANETKPIPEDWMGE